MASTQCSKQIPIVDEAHHDVILNVLPDLLVGVRPVLHCGRVSVMGTSAMIGREQVVHLRVWEWITENLLKRAPLLPRRPQH